VSSRPATNGPRLRNGIVKIGVIVPTQGPYALLGNSFVAAVQMAANDLSNTKYRYELVIRDSGPDPAKAVAVIRDLVRADNVQAIVGGVSLIGQVTKPYATAARIPHIRPISARRLTCRLRGQAMTRKRLIKIIVTAVIALILGGAYVIVVNHDPEMAESEIPMARVRIPPLPIGTQPRLLN
jgi:ABC-type branched-subunit amino acid transport system substrate-binding protein